jgi:hypothetical protein
MPKAKKGLAVKAKRSPPKVGAANPPAAKKAAALSARPLRDRNAAKREGGDCDAVSSPVSKPPLHAGTAGVSSSKPPVSSVPALRAVPAVSSLPAAKSMLDSPLLQRPPAVSQHHSPGNQASQVPVQYFYDTYHRSWKRLIVADPWICDILECFFQYKLRNETCFEKAPFAAKFLAVLRIHDIFVWIRILQFSSLTFKMPTKN